MAKHSTAGEPRTGGRHVAVLSRRAFATATGSLLATAGGIVTASVGLEQGTADAQGALPRAATGAAAALTAKAAATVGRPLAASPWQLYFGGRLTEWNAAWVAWLLQGRAPKTTEVPALLSWARRNGHVDRSPAPGSLIFSLPAHATVPVSVGIVETVTSGVPQIIEGGAPANLDPAHRFVRRYSAPWAPAALYGHLRLA